MCRNTQAGGAALTLPPPAATTPFLLGTLQLACLKVTGFRGQEHTNHRYARLCPAARHLLFKPRLLAKITVNLVSLSEGNHKRTGEGRSTGLKLFHWRTNGTVVPRRVDKEGGPSCRAEDPEMRFFTKSCQKPSPAFHSERPSRLRR